MKSTSPRTLHVELLYIAVDGYRTECWYFFFVKKYWIINVYSTIDLYNIKHFFTLTQRPQYTHTQTIRIRFFGPHIRRHKLGGRPLFYMQTHRTLGISGTITRYSRGPVPDSWVESGWKSRVDLDMHSEGFLSKSSQLFAIERVSSNQHWVTGYCFR